MSGCEGKGVGWVYLQRVVVGLETADPYVSEAPRRSVYAQGELRQAQIEAASTQYYGRERSVAVFGLVA